MAFQVWFLKEQRRSSRYTIRFNVPAGFGAIQIRPSFVTSSTAAVGVVYNLSAQEVSGSYLLYRPAHAPKTAWRQFALWVDDAPSPDALPAGEWCLFVPRGKSLHPSQPLDGWPRIASEVESVLSTQTTHATRRNSAGQNAAGQNAAGQNSGLGGREALQAALRKRVTSRAAPGPSGPSGASGPSGGGFSQVGVRQLEQAPVSAVRHLRRINERLVRENHDLRARIAELEQQLQ